MRLRSLALSFVGAALLVAGCGGAATSREGADLAEGKELFVQECAGCHTLADAGTQGQTGPNLDHGLGYPKSQGYDESTLFEITLQQMRIPAPPMPDYDEEGSEPHLEEDELVNVAAYVARCAGVEIADSAPTECVGRQQAAAGGGEEEGGTDGKSLFASTGCGSCHTLSAAGSSGTTGPNLDESKPSLEEAIAQIRDGGGGMPAYKDQLSEDQIEALAQFVSGE